MRQFNAFRVALLIAVLCLCAVWVQPAHASKARELTAACRENPSHQVCVDIAAKKAKAKARADAKVQAQIDAVLGK